MPRIKTQQNAVPKQASGRARTVDRDRPDNAAVAHDVRACADRPLSCLAVEALAFRFRILAEPMRVRLLGQLREAEMCVSDLVAALGTAQPNISRHLHVLEQAGILGHRRAGNLVYYFVADEGVFKLFRG